MSRRKKEVLKQRKDGRYRTVYKGIYFTGRTSDEAIAKREAYKEVERSEEIKLIIGPPLEDFAEKWLKNAKPEALPQTKKEAQILLHKLTDRYGYFKISDIKPSDIKEVYTEEFAGYSDSYIKAASQLYKALFDAAVEDGYCKLNPARAKSAQPHKGYEKSHRAITPTERKWILDNCQDHKLYPAVMAMLYAGLRPPEAKALNLDNAFDPIKMTLKLTEFAHLKDSNHYEVTTTGKTKKSSRTIPVFPPLYNAIKDKHGLLIPTENGKIITISAWKSAWSSYIYNMETAINGCPKRWYGKTKEHKAILAEAERLQHAGKRKEAAAKRAEIPPWQSFTVKPYDLRHSFCVMCRDNDVELNTCVEWMGHKDAKMILKIYDTVSYERSILQAEKLRNNYFKGQNKGQMSEETT